MKKVIVSGLLSLLFAGLPARAQDPTRPGVAWTFQAGGEIWGGLSVVDGVIYLGSDDGRLYAVDAQNGTEIWHFTAGDKIRSRPAVTESLVYANCDDGYLYAVQRQDGTLAWRADAGAETAGQRKQLGLSRDQWDYQQSSPAVAEGIVYVGGLNKLLFAFDAATGAELWRFQVEDKPGAVFASPTVANGIVYIGGDWGAFHAIKARTGEAIWKADLETGVRSAAAVADGRVYIGSRATWLKAFDAATGAEIWRFSYGISWVESTAVIVDGVIYIGSSDAQRLNAIDAATGTEIWHADTSGYPWGMPATANGVVYIGAVTRRPPHFYAVDARTGQPIWTFETGQALAYNFDGVASSPVAANGLVYFGSLDGKLYAIEAPLPGS